MYKKTFAFLGFLALLVVPLSISADSGAYRIGVGAQMTCVSSVPTHISTRGTVWCNSSDSDKLYYTDSAGTSAAVSGAGGSGYATIKEEGSSLTARTTVNFIGAPITCVDNGGSTRTDCTVRSGQIAQTSQISIGAGTPTTSSGTFGDIGDGSTTGFADYSYTPSVAGDYTVRFILSGVYGSGGIAKIELQIVVDGSAVASQPTWRVPAGASQYVTMTGSMPVTLTAAAHAIKLQWRVASGTAAVDGGYSALAWTVSQ